MDELTIAGTRSVTTVLDSPRAVTVVPSAKIRDHQSRTTPEALQEETGILVQETSLGGGSPFLRGQVGNRVLVLVDGIRLNNSTFRFGPNQYGNTIDPHSIDRIEIVRGPASVLYGSDALGGVIHVITKRRADFTEPFDVDARILSRFSSAALEKTLRVESGGNAGHFGFQGGATLHDFDDLRSGSGEQDHTGYREADGDARLQYRLAPGHELAFTFQRVTQFRVPNTVAFVHDQESFFFEPQERTLFALDHEVAGRPAWLRSLRSTVSVHRQREVRKRRRFDSTTERREEDRVTTFGATTQADLPLGERHLLVAGAEVYHDEVDSGAVATDTASGERSPARGSFPDGATYDSLATYAQATVELLPRLSLIGGARYSSFSLDADVGGSFGNVAQSFDDVTAAAALVFRPIEPLRLIASVSQGFRAPNLDDTVVLRSLPEQNGVDAPNPDLDPERVDNYEAGAKMSWPLLDASLFYYHSDYGDLIERRPGSFEGLTFLDENGNGVQDFGEPDVFTRQNVGDAVVQGVETDFEIRINPSSDLFGNLSWARGENRSAGEPFSRIPPLLGLAGLRWRSFDGRLWAEYYSRVAGTQDRLSSRDRSDVRIPPGGTPGWQTQNVRAGCQPVPPLRLVLALENFTNERYRIHGSGIDAPGINVVSSAEWRF